MYIDLNILGRVLIELQLLNCLPCFLQNLEESRLVIICDKYKLN